jgi:UDP-N-acetyl-2-amino-2-deoxyglucuronate dehydrogenase
MKLKKKIKIGIVGLGRVVNHYYNIFSNNKIKNAEIVSLCDKNLIAGNFYKKKFSAKFFKNYKNPEFYNKIDVILILTPSGSHFKICEFFLKKKKHVLCEKPLTMIPRKSLELYKLAKMKKVMCGVIFQNRFNPSIQLVRKYIQQNKFGKLVNISISLLWCRYQNYYNDGWHGTWKNDGGVLSQQCIHHLDIMRWVFGPIDKVNCITTKRLNKLQAEDTAVGTVQFVNGSLGLIEATTAARPMDLHASLSIVGEKGTVVVGGLAMNEIKVWKFINQTRKKELEIIKKNSQVVSTGYGISHINYLNLAFKTILNKKITPPVDAHEAYLTSKFLHGLYKSAETKKWISIKSNPVSKKLGNNN